MYTLILIIVGLGACNTTPTTEATHFYTASKKECDTDKAALTAQSTHHMQIKVFCVPRV